MSSSSNISASGFCAACGTVHSLGEGNSRKYALELMEQLEKYRRMDLSSAPKEPDPVFSTDYLWGDARGQMFGVLECEDGSGNTVVLKAFSCQYDGEWLIDGWVPPILDPKQFYDLIAEPDRQINIRTRALKGMEKSHPHYRTLFDERKALSQQLMKEIHALYRLTNFRGETRALTEILSGNIPMGVGECCAPKLLNYAALNGLKPVGLSEFYWGRENKSGTRQHKQFYPACVEKCQPILGFMLCGIKELPANHTNIHESEFGNHSCEFVKLRGQRIEVEIIYKESEFLVVNKPSGLLSVPGKGEANQDCVTARIKALYPDCIDQPEVHRLDMDTSGLMVLALTADAQRELSRQFHDRETEKRYIALLDGEVDGDEGVIELPFRLDVDNRPVQIYDPVHGKIGITRWRKLGIETGSTAYFQSPLNVCVSPDRDVRPTGYPSVCRPDVPGGRFEQNVFEGVVTRVEFFPITGRTHQLRVHAASEHGLGVPIIGDRLYGSGTAPGQLKLHASYLSFTHPILGKKLAFRSEPPF